MLDAIVILAGGQGKRLWPVSTRMKPKQLIDLGDGITLLSKTVLRARALAPDAPIYIVSHSSQVDAIVEDIGNKVSGAVFVIPEPLMCNTAPAIILAASFIAWRHSPQATMLVLPADQFITPVEQLRDVVNNADMLAREGFLLTIGILPRQADTGYGYLRRGAPTGPGWRVSAFTEKPDHATAEQYLNTGEYFWNSGMFVFGIQDLLIEARKYAPRIMNCFAQLPTDLGSIQDVRVKKGVHCLSWRGDTVQQLYGELADNGDSIDYMIMEKSKSVAMVVFTGFWSDVGSWDEIVRLAEAGNLDSNLVQDCEGVYRAHDVLVSAFNAHNNYAYSRDFNVAFCGVNNIGVVVDNGTILVFQRGTSQNIRNLCEYTEENRVKDKKSI